MSSPKTSVARTASANPATRAVRPRLTAPRSRLSMPSAVAMIAPYSGPTTIAATMRICELVRMPTAPIRPAMTRSAKKLGGYWPPARIFASTMLPHRRDVAEARSAPACVSRGRPGRSR